MKTRLVSLLACLVAVNGGIAQPRVFRPPVPRVPGTIALASTLAGRSVYIKSRSAQQYLDVMGGSSVPGTTVRLFRFNATKAQVFTFEDAGNDQYRIRTNTGGFYLTLERELLLAQDGDTGGGPAYHLAQREREPVQPNPIHNAAPIAFRRSQLWRVLAGPDESTVFLVNAKLPTHALRVSPGMEHVGYTERTGGEDQQWIIKHAQLREQPFSDQADRGIANDCTYRFTVYWFHTSTFPKNFARVMPEWRSVGETAPPAQAGFHPLPALQTLEGKVTRAGVSMDDAPLSHFTHDFTFDVLPDPIYRFLLANKGSAGVQKQVEVEWESGLAQGDHATNPCAWRNRRGASCGSFSAGHDIGDEIWNWPGVNDRVHVEGEWIWDRGHPPASTEIHPPRFVAVQRDLPDKYVASPTTFFYATRADLFASSDGGALRNNTGNPAFAQRVAMSEKDYTVTLTHMLPRPPGNPALKVAFVRQRAHSFPNSERFPTGYDVAIFSDGTPDIPQGHVTVTIPWRAMPAPDDAVFARTMFLYWDAPLSHGVPSGFEVRRVGVTVERLEILKNGEGGDIDPDESRFFANAGGKWLFLNEFTGATDILSDGLGESTSGAILLLRQRMGLGSSGIKSDFAFNQTLELYVPPGKELPFNVAGWEDDYIGGHFGQLLNPFSNCAALRSFMDRHFDGADAHGQGKEDDHMGKAEGVISYVDLPRDDLFPVTSAGVPLGDGGRSSPGIFRASFRITTEPR
jgi:hypothetical protein